MFSKFFIERPIFSIVIAVVMLLAGVLTVTTLPVSQYPDITPPTVRISATYPGADAETVAKTIAVPIEQQVNGIENMMYMSSNCGSDGSYSLTVTFEVGTDLDRRKSTEPRGPGQPATARSRDTARRLRDGRIVQHNPFCRT